MPPAILAENEKTYGAYVYGANAILLNKDAILGDYNGIRLGAEESFEQRTVERIASAKAELEDIGTTKGREAKDVQYRLDTLETMKRWSISQDKDCTDPLAATVMHEGFHALQANNAQLNTELVVRSSKIVMQPKDAATVSAYAAYSHNDRELFAEAATGRALGLDKDYSPKVNRWLNTVSKATGVKL